jgi:hypothetical protein
MTQRTKEFVEIRVKILDVSAGTDKGKNLPVLVRAFP